ncbi:chitinase N-terminal domain-containing protein [Planotetraspora silvatica]|nr:chitinase N-terminal domain-containing protein [Planotetraspora silvatica]
MLLVPVIPAQAYSPTGGIMYQLGSDPCLKGRGNCAIYPKSAQLPSGRLVASFEKATVVPETGGADRETLPIYKSDDYGTTWQSLSEVKAPAYLSSDPQYAKYTSNWTNPYLYVLPQDVGSLKAGTLLLASVVSGDDYYYKEHKAADPTWSPSSDGDRKDLAIALYSSTDEGVTWNVVNVIATGGWQGGSAGAIGRNVAGANTYKQVDPLWEPYLMVYDGELICYYSDENDYIGFDPATGVATLDPNNDTATDSQGQVLVHKTWDGSSSAWSDPVIDVSGLTQNMGGGKAEIGGGRPGMTNVVPTMDGKWLITYEYWGGGANVRYKVADDPLKFYADGDPAGTPITSLPVDSGSKKPATGGSPVTIKLPDGRLVYNASGSGDVWVNQSGRSDGVWKEYQTSLGSGYSRNLQYVNGTGRIVILRNQGTSTIAYGEVDLGHSEGAYYRLVNRKTGQVIGTGGKTNDANIGNGDVPDVVLEDAGSAVSKDTQYWHIFTAPNGGVSLLNKSGGRAAAIWTGNATVGQKIGQWVDNSPTGSWNLIKSDDGYYKLQAVKNTGVYLTGSTTGAALTLQNAVSDGSQEWQLAQEAPAADDLTSGDHSASLISSDTIAQNGTLSLNATVTHPVVSHANVTGHVYALTPGSSTPVDLGAVSFGSDQKATVSLPGALKAGDSKIAVVFDETPMMWDSVYVLPGDGAASAPAKGVLSSNNGWDDGLRDGDYTITMNLWWGQNADLIKLYENGELVATRDLTFGGDDAQNVSVDISGRPNGEYKYTGVLVNSKGSTETAPLTVKVTDANPGKPVLSADNWDGDGTYTVTADLWWGQNATSYRFLENGAVVATGDFASNTPAAQQAKLNVSGKAAGTYVYTVEFSNAAGATTSSPLTVKVTN